MDEKPGSMSRSDYSSAFHRTDAPNSDDPAQIRADIDETRAEMSETIDELAQRLDPDRLKAEAKTVARDATIGHAEAMLDTAQERTKEVGNTLMDTVKRNPFPVALIGIGAGWLVMSGRDSGKSRRDYDDDYRQTYYSGSPRGPYAGMTSQRMTSEGERDEPGLTEKAGQQAGQMTQQAQQHIEHYSDQAQQMAGQAQSTLQRFMNENPLAAAAIALGVGFAVGYAVPETQKEDELLGEAHAAAMHRAAQMMDSAIDKASESDTVSQKVDELTHTAAEKAKDATHQAMNQ